MYINITGSAAFWFCEDVELLLAAEGILRGADIGVYKIFGDLSAYRRKYRLASEINAALADDRHGVSLLEGLHGFGILNFTLAGFHKHLLALGDLPSVLLDCPADKPEETEARFKDYLSASSFILRVGEYVAEVFALAEELRTDAFRETLGKYAGRVTAALENAGNELATLDPLLYSDKLLNKKMFNRGPYGFFIFAPAVFSYWRAVRYIKRGVPSSWQFLFFSLRDAAIDNEQIFEKLKALGDINRFKIEAIVKERGHVSGTELAKSIGLSAATVSYHVRMLRDAGLLNEEQDGTTRIYSIPGNAAELMCTGINNFLA